MEKVGLMHPFSSLYILVLLELQPDIKLLTIIKIPDVERPPCHDLRCTQLNPVKLISEKPILLAGYNLQTRNYIKKLIDHFHVVVKGEQKPSEIGVRAGNSRWVANVVVAKDGSGNYRSIQEAVDRAPDNSPRRYVIYIKAGWYNENVVVEAWKKNLAFVGDGIGKTVLNSYRSAPYSIFDSAALGT
ncbi:hypothetical protein H6P81_019748 [Aristolochia fimbriata]|uniref:Pectinesterase catalytic domain-containing protein n=1 Tax=Aristolochia fimbriata TaxID=158543 RepID=A0AAV7DSP3_ARIFI|nr:hypothetical protein H6P81_019748 [Aristolochia fimbriata]